MTGKHVESELAACATLPSLRGRRWGMQCFHIVQDVGALCASWCCCRVVHVRRRCRRRQRRVAADAALERLPVRFVSAVSGAAPFVRRGCIFHLRPPLPSAGPHPPAATMPPQAARKETPLEQAARLQQKAIEIAQRADRNLCMESLRLRPECTADVKRLLINLGIIDSSGKKVLAPGQEIVAVQLRPTTVPKTLDDVQGTSKLHRNYSTWGSVPIIYMCWLLRHAEAVAFSECHRARCAIRTSASPERDRPPPSTPPAWTHSNQ